jgi:hypothetical protein
MMVPDYWIGIGFVAGLVCGHQLPGILAWTTTEKRRNLPELRIKIPMPPVKQPLPDSFSLRPGLFVRMEAEGQLRAKPKTARPPNPFPQGFPE